jgi:hypothetical protein
MPQGQDYYVPFVPFSAHEGQLRMGRAAPYAPAIRDWLIACGFTQHAAGNMGEAATFAARLSPPAKLRPAQREDVREGVIVWFPQRYGEDAQKAIKEGFCLWALVEQGLDDKGVFIAYSPGAAMGSQRCTLQGAFVEYFE